MGSTTGNRIRLAAFALGLLLAAPAALALDWERGFSNYDRIEAGEVSEQALSAEEHSEVQLIRNTLQQFEQDQAGEDLNSLDCHALRQARRRQGQLLSSAATQLASCARRNDLPAMAASASRLATCAGSAAQDGLQDCNTLIASIRARRDGACVHEIRKAEQSQRRLVSYRMRTAEVCAAR